MTVCTCSEVYHARRWMEERRFQSHTVILADGSVVFVNDFVDFIHPLSYGVVKGKLLHLFQKV